MKSSAGLELPATAYQRPQIGYLQIANIGNCPGIAATDQNDKIYAVLHDSIQKAPTKLNTAQAMTTAVSPPAPSRPFPHYSITHYPFTLPSDPRPISMTFFIVISAVRHYRDQGEFVILDTVCNRYYHESNLPAGL